jgi:hypothetical protein
VHHAHEHLAVALRSFVVNDSPAKWHWSRHWSLLTLQPEVLRLQAAGGIWAGVLIVLTNVALRAVFLCFDYYAALALSTMGMNSVWAGGQLRDSRMVNSNPLAPLFTTRETLSCHGGRVILQSLIYVNFT